MIKSAALVLVALSTSWPLGQAAAADAPVYAPAAAWVKPIPVVETPAASGSIQLVLLNNQVKFDADGSETYSEIAIKALDAQGLAAIGNLILPWNPVTDTLTIHRVEVIRDGKTRDVLAGGKTFTVLRRESGLEASVLDGTLTATLQPGDLRVGDTLDYATTIVRSDPVLHGHAEADQALVSGVRAERVYFRDLWPAGKPVRWLAREGLPPVVATGGAGGEIVVDAKSILPPQAPVRAPGRFARLAQLQTSDYRDWTELSALLAPVFDQAARLTAASPLKAEAAKIQKASADPATRALMALQLVQEEVRYFYLALNVGGYTPAAADLTWTRRYGDCKGKTVLLLALLRELGIAAEPALVATRTGDGLNEQLPAAGAFDHVIVRAAIGGKIYWLDGTRPRDRALDMIPIPDFHWALPLTPDGSPLEALLPRPFDEPQSDKRLRLDARGGPDKPALAHAEQIYHGDAATMMRLAMKQVAAADLDRVLRQYWTGQYSWIVADKVAFTAEETKGVATLTMDGAGKMPWIEAGRDRIYRLEESSLGADVSFRREPGPFKDAPYKVAYPSFDRSEITVLLPGNGAGYRLSGAPDLEQTVAGVAYKRRSRLETGVLTMEASAKAIAPEFPIGEAADAQATLQRMASLVVVLSTTRADAADASTADTTASEPAVKDATALTSRATQNLRAGKTDAALTDFSEAVRLEPMVGKRYYNRGVAYFEANRDKEALADFNRAVRLDPEDSKAVMARGELEQLDGLDALAKADMDRAVGLAPKDSALLLRRATVYLDAWKIDAALSDYEIWLTRFPRDNERSTVLGDRCWALAVRPSDPASTERQCRTALEAAPNNGLAHDGLGVVALRRRDFDAALKQFGSALAWPDTRYIGLYGRSLAEASKGMKEAAEDDRRGSIALSPNVEAQFHRMGF